MDEIKDLKSPMLMMYGTKDINFTLEDGIVIQNIIGKNVSLVGLPCNHFP